MISVLSESQTMAAYRWDPRFRRDSVEELLVATGSWNAAWEPRRRGRVPSVPETLPGTHDDLRRTGRWHYSDITWASWCLKSLAKSTVNSQLHKNENIKATNYWPFLKGLATRRDKTDDDITMTSHKCHGVSNHQQELDCLFNSHFRFATTRISKLRITRPLRGEPTYD